MPAQTLLQFRRGTAALWASSNPVLAAGEFGYETDTNKGKIGNGTTSWNSLSYVVGSFPANQISGTSLASNVVTSALTSVGILSSLTVSGNTTLQNTLAITGDTTHTGQIIGGANSNIAINTNAFTVNATSGNTVVGGSLTVGSLANNIIYGNSTSVDNTKDVGLISKTTTALNSPLVATIATKAVTTNVATLTTSANHGFLTGDSVVVAGVDATFNGTYSVTGTPAANSFTYALATANVTATAATSTASVEITTKAVTSNVATITTNIAHGFTSGQSVTITNVDSTFNGTFTIASTPTTTSFTFALITANVSTTAATSSAQIITYKSLTSNVATLTTASAHGYTTGQDVTIAGVDSTFNGTYKVVSAPTSTTFTYNLTGSNINVSTVPATTGSATVITTKALTSNVATITTATNHGLTTGQYVGVQNVDSTFNGVWLVASTPTSTTFTYAVTAANVSSQEAGILVGTNILTKDLTNGVATISTYAPHGVNVGDTIVVAGVDVNFNGTWTVTSTPTAYSLSYTPTNPGYNESAYYASTYGAGTTITTGSVTTNIATVTTSAVHNLIAGQWITITGANNNVYNGNWLIQTVPTTTSITFYVQTTTVGSATINGTISPLAIAVTNIALTSNVATLTTSQNHGYSTGQWIIVNGVSAIFNGIYQIASTPTVTTLTYNRVADNVVSVASIAPGRVGALLGTLTRRYGSAAQTGGTAGVLAGRAASPALLGTGTVTSPVRGLYSGLVKVAADGSWRLFNGVQTLPGNTVSLIDTNLTYGNLQLGALTATNASLSGTLAVTGKTTFTGNIAGTASSGYSNFNGLVNNIGTVTGSILVDVSQGPVIVMTPIGNTTITFSNYPNNGFTGYWEVEVVNPGANTVSFVGITWNGGAAPVLQSGSKTTVFTFRTRNGGSKIYGSTSFSDIV
jgi:hypothetical protein